jgi:hypothetical protein
MFALLLISIVAVPVLAGTQAAKVRDRRRGLAVLLATVLVYDLGYILMLYYLRFRWSAG